MKFFLIVAAALAWAGTAGAFGGHEGGGREGGGGGGSSGAVYHRRKVSVPAPSAPAHGVEGANHVAYPQRDGGGRAISTPAARVPPSHHNEVVRNAAVVHGIEHQRTVENQPNHYYWHTSNGVQYSHYYDGHNHWYGFYHGPTFYWTRYNAGRWWWYDSHVSRWVYWWNGFWWWPGPAGVAYVYVDNNYYPYESEGVTVQNAVVPAAPAAVPEPSAGKNTPSPDGKRSVQVFGDDAQAFLYDTTVTPPKFLKYLGSGVAQARFSGGTAGAPLQVLVEFKDGTFALFDGEGSSQSAAVLSTQSGTAPPSDVPDSVPPPPSSAPGQ
jgi:hypothetical protein